MKGYLLGIGLLAYLLGCAPAPTNVAIESNSGEIKSDPTEPTDPMVRPEPTVRPDSQNAAAPIRGGDLPSSESSGESIGVDTSNDLQVDMQLLGQTPAQPQELFFEDYTATTGIEFSYSNGRSANEYAIVESLGGGVGIVDFDNDGLLDVLFTGGGSLDNKTLASRRSGLFRNIGDWRFEDITDSAHTAADHCFTHGVATGDIDADGFEDLAISGYGAVQILMNQGDGTFIALEPMVTHSTHAWSSSLAWGDLDNNGHLDLYVAHYVDWSWDKHPICAGQGVPREVCAPREFNGLADAIYFNEGYLPFRRESESIGLRADGKGLGVAIGNFDADTAVDIYVANDTTDNFLYLNQGNGTFAESAVFAGVSGDDAGVSTGSMGVCVFDYNSDQLPDLFVTNFERELSALYRNEGTVGFFSFASRQAGLASYGSSFVGFGTVAIDFNFDNQQDLVISNGHVSYHSPHAPYRQIPLLLENQLGKFQLRPTSGYFSSPHTGRGLASGDFDNDGALDLAVSHLEEPIAMLRCRPPVSQHAAPHAEPATDEPLTISTARLTAEDKHWGIVRLVGTSDNRSAIGAALHWEEAGRRHARFNVGGGSYLSANDRRIHLYWPSGVEQIAVEVAWPSGFRERFDVSASRETVLRQGTGQNVDAP